MSDGSRPEADGRRRARTTIRAAARDEDISIQWDGTVTGDERSVRRPAPGRFVFVRDTGAVPEAEIYVRPHVIAQAMAHAREAPDREVGGLLVGELCDDPGLGPGRFVRIVRAVRFPGVGTSSHLEITGDMLEQARADARADGLIDVGWYHSHPNWGIFLSETDHTQFQDSHFNKPWHVALVVDPRRGEHGFFVRFRGGDGRAQRTSYFYLWEAGEDRSFAPAGRPDEGGPAESEPEAARHAREQKLARARRVLCPDPVTNPEYALPLIGSRGVTFNFEGQRQKSSLSPVFRACRAEGRKDGSRAAVSVVIAESDLADKEEELGAVEREMGFLLGRFGRQGREDFVIVKRCHALPVTHDARTYAKWLDSTEVIAEQAVFVTEDLKRSGSDLRVVGWYYRAPYPSDSLPEDHVPVITDVFRDHRFVTLAFFAAAPEPGKDAHRQSEDEPPLSHHVFVTHGQFSWGERAAVSSIDLLSTRRKRTGPTAPVLPSAAEPAETMEFRDEKPPAALPEQRAAAPAASQVTGQRPLREAEEAGGLPRTVRTIIIALALVLAAVACIIAAQRLGRHAEPEPAAPVESSSGDALPPAPGDALGVPARPSGREGGAPAGEAREQE